MGETQGIVFGRFQPLHVGHLEYLLAANERCSHLTIGVTQPDVDSLAASTLTPRRSERLNNPLPYFQRARIISAALSSEGLAACDFQVVPADIDRPGRGVNFLPTPQDSVAFLTIYDAWGEQKRELVALLGFQVEILWTRTNSDRVTSGAIIRSLIRSGGQWKHLVPRAAVDLIEAGMRRHMGSPDSPGRVEEV